MKNKTPIVVKCLYCYKLFEKPQYQYYNSEKYRQGRHFCSSSCKFHYFRPATMVKITCRGCGKVFEMKKQKYTQRQKVNGGVYYCSNGCFHKSRQNPFTYFVDKAKQRSKKSGVECDLDKHFLKELWETQEGRCPYTKIKMIMPETKKYFSRLCSIEKASLDKIDPSKGYTKENVGFVCQGINFAKNDYSKKEVLDFIEHIKNTL